MGKRLAITLLLLLSAITLWAETEVYLRPALALTYDTSVFSYPLPDRDDAAYMRRLGLGFYLDADVFFSKDGKAGLSLSFLYSNPVKIDNIVNGNPGSNYDWVYTTDPDIYLALGSMFRATIGEVRLGIALRLEVGSNNLFQDSMNLGLQVEPYIMIPLGTESLLFSAGLLYNAHFYDFVLNSTSWYRDDYFLLTVGGYVGLAYSWRSW